MLKRGADRPPAGSGRRLAAREEVWRVFRGLCERQTPVTLQFESVNTVYSARIVDVDHRRATIGGIHPRSGEMLLGTGRDCRLSARSDGALIEVPRLLGLSSAPGRDGGTEFIIELPTELRWQQRRADPRFSLPSALAGTRTRIMLMRGAHMVAGTADQLSASGCAATFAAPAHDLLRRDSIDRARLDIAGLMSIGPSVAIRRRLTDPQTGAMTCGLEFTRMDPDDEERLERFLRNLAKRERQA